MERIVLDEQHADIFGAFSVLMLHNPSLR